MIHSVVSQILKKRWKRILQDQKHPKLAQDRAFRKLQRSLFDTEVGRNNNMFAFGDSRGFVRNTPATKYDDMAAMIQRTIAGEKNVLFRDRLQYLGLSSGTTGQNSKKIPFNTRQIKNFEDYQTSFVAMMEAHTDLSIFRDSRLVWGSTPEIGQTETGIPEGYVSGFIATRTPKIMQRATYPSRDVQMMGDMNQKVSRAAEELRNADIRLISGVPTYLIALMEELKEKYGVEDLSTIWPNVEACVYSAMPIHTYRDRIDRLLGKKIKYLGVYASTEGMVGYEIPSLNGNKSGVYSFHYGDVVYGFRDLKTDEIYSISELQPGHEVELLLSSPNGLLNYRTGDCLRIVSTKPSVLFEIIGRVGHGINVATEKASLSQLEKAALSTAKELNAELRHYFIHPGTAANGKPCYEWTLITDQGHNLDKAKAAELLDRAMDKLNGDYEEARKELFFLEAPIVNTMEASVIERYFERDKARGQLKMKSAFDSKELFEEFISPFVQKVAA